MIGEKVGSAGKTEYDDAFKEQLAQTSKTATAVERVHDALEGYVKALRTCTLYKIIWACAPLVLLIMVY